VNELLAYLAAKGDALALGVLLGAAITLLWLYPPNRHEKPPTRPATSNRKSGRVTTGGAR
jgi:hypothetical protein